MTSSNTQAAPSRTTKKASVLKCLQRAKGASIAELCKQTGWQPHSVRAMLSGLRKDGFAIERTTTANGACYRIAPQPAASS